MLNKKVTALTPHENLIENMVKVTSPNVSDADKREIVFRLHYAFLNEFGEGVDGELLTEIDFLGACFWVKKLVSERSEDFLAKKNMRMFIVTSEHLAKFKKAVSVLEQNYREGKIS
jgi:hypothetical protein